MKFRNRLVLILFLLITACNHKLEINSIPLLSDQNVTVLERLPRYNPEIISSYQLDLRMQDLSSINLTARRYDLEHSVFDNYTQWPDDIETVFDPGLALNNNSNPGLHIRRLHAKGIIGEGVKIAVIDQLNSLRHREYENRIQFYGQYGPIERKDTAYHAPAVTSILAGTNTGIAISTEVLYFSTAAFDTDGELTCEYETAALEAVLEYNRKHADKIDVVSLSSGANHTRPYYREYLTAIKKLEESGVAVFTPDLFERKNMHVYGLRRDYRSNPDDVFSYTPISWPDWILKIHKFPELQSSYISYVENNESTKLPLLVPVDPKTFAGNDGEEQYIYKFLNGWSWIPPYLAGLYSLCKQVSPEISLETFWNSAYETGFQYEFACNGEVLYGRIVNPEALITMVGEGF